MWSIQVQSALVFPLYSQLKQSPNLGTPKVPLFSSGEAARLVSSSSSSFKRQLQFRYLQTKAMNTSIFIGIASPFKSGDLSDFLLISALLLGLYWISNFVVPELVFKFFELDKGNENQKRNDKPVEDE